MADDAPLMSVADMEAFDSKEMKAVFNIICNVGISRGNSKRHILEVNKDNKLLQAVLKATYDPSITYGVTEVNGLCDQVWAEGRPTMNWANAQATLDHLAKRELTGNSAQEALDNLFAKLSQSERYILIRVIRRDMRMGCGRNTVSKVWPDLFPVFKCALAHKFEDKRFSGVMPVEPKLDGVRVLALVSAVLEEGEFAPRYRTAEVSFVSRSGKEFTTFEHLVEPLRAKLDQALIRVDTDGTSLWPMLTEELDLVLDGEITAGSFNETSGSVRRKSEQAPDAVLHLFDIIPMTEFYKGSSLSPFDIRRDQLTTIFGQPANTGPIRVLSQYKASSPAEVHHYYELFREQGLEGVVVKQPKHFYVTKRSHAWLKIKAEESVECKILRAVKGDPGKKNENTFGGFWVDHKGVEVAVRSGFKDGERDGLWAMWLRDQQRLAGEHEGEFELYERIVEVEFHEETPDGSLRHPRFKRFRDTLTGAFE